MNEAKLNTILLALEVLATHTEAQKLGFIDDVTMSPTAMAALDVLTDQFYGE